MANLLQKLCCKIIIVLVFMLIELFILIKKLKSSATRPITTKQYLKFIEEKNPTICYNKGWSKEKAARHMDCTVCLSEFEEGEKLRRLRCQHIFHRDCLDKWLQEYLATCPLCRTKVLPDDVVSKHREHRNLVDSDGESGGDRLQFLLAALRGNALNR